jgi:hypothetical protein
MYRVVAVRYVCTHITVWDLLGWLAEKLVIHEILQLQVYKVTVVWFGTAILLYGSPR